MYQWAKNQSKLARAIAFCKENGDSSEEAIKARYVVLAGLVVEAKQQVENTKTEETSSETPRAQSGRGRSRASRNDDVA